MWSALCCKWCLSLRMLRRHNRFRRFFAVIGCLCLLIVILLAVQQPIICDSLSTIKENIQYNSTKCKGVHVAFSCQQTEDVREAIHMLTSLLYFRSNHVTLYIFATPVTQHILQTIFTTWDVGQLEVNYYNTKIGQTFTDHVHLLNHRVLVKVLFVSVKVRFLTDITTYFLANHEDTKSTFIQSSPITMTTYFTDSVIHIQPLGCTWVYTSQCPSTTGFPQAIFRSSSASCITRSIGRSNPCLCAMLEELSHLDPHRFRDLSFQSACLSKQFTPAKLFYKNNICWRFYRSTVLTYMTHIYYYSTGRDITPFGAIDEVTPAITMVTILTMNRFEVFVRTVSHWNGPVIAVVYGSPKEIHTLISNISSSAISSFDVIYHVVYDNEEFVPLNYLRNIGLNSSTTMYTIYNDVDLVPVPNLHDTLVRKIPTWNQMATDTGEKYAFIVPCFNAADPISKRDFPKNQAELITLWHNDTVDDWVKWPFGHSIVDYMRWKFSTESYEVYYEHHSEPYLVLQTSSMPTYDVMVPDGMRDKIQYTLVLYAQNYHFMVVEEVFLLHLPHKFSRSREVFSNGPVTFNQCIMSIYIDFVQKLVKEYPEMIVPRKVLNEIRFHRSLVNARAHGHLPTINEISRFMWMNLRNEISDDKEWY